MKLSHKLEQDKPDAILDSERTRLLLVDDDLKDTEALRKMLFSNNEIDFFHCADPLKATAVASDIQPTIILQALFMSGANSLDLVKEFRKNKELSDVSIIIYLIEDEASIKEDIFLAGADDYLIKSSGKVETIRRIRHFSRSCTENRALQAAIEELGEMRDQIFQSEKMASIGQLAAGVAHEINNPVAFVSSNINSMCGYYDDVFSVIDTYNLLEVSLSADLPEVKAVKAVKKRLQLNFIKEDIEQILNECKDGLTRIRKIVDDLKNFSREEKVEWKWSNLHKEIDSTLNIANHEIKYKAEVKKDYGDIPEIECIPSQLNQVFLNLFVNAAHAIDGHGTITLTTSTGTLPKAIAAEMVGCDYASENSWVCISVADTGSGIDTGTIQHIFDTFFTTKPIGKGTGLGLSLSRNIVKNHGGYIAVDSEYGKGTTFSIWLPVHQPDITES